jgi:hypothetical protein
MSSWVLLKAASLEFWGYVHAIADAVAATAMAMSKKTAIAGFFTGTPFETL